MCCRGVCLPSGAGAVARASLSPPLARMGLIVHQPGPGRPTQTHGRPRRRDGRADELPGRPTGRRQPQPMDVNDASQWRAPHQCLTRLEAEAAWW